MRASLVSEDALFQFAQEIELGSLVCGWAAARSWAAAAPAPAWCPDAFEALIAALYLDGGLGKRPPLLSCPF